MFYELVGNIFSKYLSAWSHNNIISIPTRVHVSSFLSRVHIILYYRIQPVPIVPYTFPKFCFLALEIKRYCRPAFRLRVSYKHVFIYMHVKNNGLHLRKLHNYSYTLGPELSKVDSVNVARAFNTNLAPLLKRRRSRPTMAGMNKILGSAHQ